MLNPFPQMLLTGGGNAFFIPTLLRIAASITFIYIAQYLVRESDALEKLRVPIVGKVQSWMVWLSIVVVMLVAFCLFIGFETQWAAIIGMLLALKHGIAPKRYRDVLPFPSSTYILLFIICLSLLFSGAGALAFDLPL